VAALFLISRMPWDKIWHGIKYLLHIP
jgi:hypothetical protein